MGLLVILGALSVAPGAHAEAGKKRASAKPRRYESGADLEEGWITKQTEKGAVKVRAKQTFLFEGSDVEGQVNRPSQSIFGNRPTYRESTLIPERASFRREFNETSGFVPAPGRTR